MPNTFNLSLARQLARYSQAAYAPVAGPGQTLITAPRSRCSVLLEDVGDAIVLAFQGTKNLPEAVEDAKIIKRNIGGQIAVHSGGLDAYNELAPLFIPLLQARRPCDCKPLRICGHSLGGMLATFAAYFLEINCGYRIESVYTFASPRVGDAQFRTAYNAFLGGRTFRVVAAGDLVPLLPGIFTPPLNGYRHVGTEVFLDGGVRIQPSHLWELAIDGWRTYWAIKRADWDFIREFHSIAANYIAALDQIANQTATQKIQ